MNITQISNPFFVKTEYIEGFTKVLKKPNRHYVLIRKGDVLYAGYSVYADSYSEYYDITLGNFFKRIVACGTMTAKIDHYRDEQVVNVHDIGIFQDSKTYYEEPYDKNGEPNYYPIFFYPYIELRMVSGRTYYIMAEKEEQLDEIISIAKSKCNYMRCCDEPSKCRYITETLDIIVS